LSSSTVECAVGWPRPVSAGMASCRGVAAPLRVFGEPRCRRAYRVDAKPPCRSTHPSAETPGRSDFEATTPRPIPTLESVGRSPLRIGLSFTVSPTSHRRSGSTEVLSRPCSVRGSFPYSVLPVTRSHLAPAGTQPTGSVASSGFRTLSTPCSPCDLADLFHSASALGVSLRGFSPRGAVRPLERRTPRVFGSALSGFASPTGIEHTARILHAGLGFSQVTASLPPWVWPLRGFLHRSAVDRATSPPPLSRFSGSAAC
jgi:hypothetical protein